MGPSMPMAEQHRSTNPFLTPKDTQPQLGASDESSADGYVPPGFTQNTDVQQAQ